ncbi:hypothetical protein FIC_01243 [Flavobacteriaceae bacterium 3519-10]|nr:hypothetical protein FIC_01243 [Flavobacteriaceae bacterium 3519-10]
MLTDYNQAGNSKHFRPQVLHASALAGRLLRRITAAAFNLINLHNL